MERASFAELGAGTQGCLLLLLVLATAASPVILGAHAAALLVLRAHVGAVKSLGAAEAQMRHIRELKLETLAAFQACVRGRPCLVRKHHTHAHHMITQRRLGASLPSSPLQIRLHLSGAECLRKNILSGATSLSLLVWGSAVTEPRIPRFILICPIGLLTGNS